MLYMIILQYQINASLVHQHFVQAYILSSMIYQVTHLEIVYISIKIIDSILTCKQKESIIYFMTYITTTNSCSND
jgi:hypothetical protein